ncbi:MAG TPA: hypothetical protein VKT31_11760 [Solirubrobacteraceae bacterium]|nr:hypothetical protein [Solirubrobacteraceae bacterium]
MPRTSSLGRARRQWLLAVAALILILPLAAAHAARAASSTVCTGNASAPGVLTGAYNGNVVVNGICFVNAGPAIVNGNLTITDGSTVIAAFGRNNSSLSVTGNVRVNTRGTLLLGCLPTSFPCIDDPTDHPTLSSHGSVGGQLIEDQPLGVIVHDSTIGGAVTEAGGGGGVSCDPSGVFALFGSPVYSDYEDSTIGGSLVIRNMRSCWLGVARLTIAGNATFTNNRFADPDAIEIIANHIGENLSCSGNSMVWDSAELDGGLYPRLPEPNTVGGTRSGQCVLASPKDQGGPPGPGPF